MMPVNSSGPTSAIKVIPISVPSAQFKQVDARFRQLVVDTGVAEMRKNMQAGIFKNPTGAGAGSIRGQVEGTAVVWWSDLPSVAAQEKGVRPHAMWYLLNKTIPIRSSSFGGERVTYRRATLKSFMLGKWFHKGYAGKFFMKKAVDTVVVRIPDLLRKAQEDVNRGIR